MVFSQQLTNTCICLLVFFLVFNTVHSNLHGVYSVSSSEHLLIDSSSMHLCVSGSIVKGRFEKASATVGLLVGSVSTGSDGYNLSSGETFFGDGLNGEFEVNEYYNSRTKGILKLNPFGNTDGYMHSLNLEKLYVDVAQTEETIPFCGFETGSVNIDGLYGNGSSLCYGSLIQGSQYFAMTHKSETLGIRQIYGLVKNGVLIGNWFDSEFSIPSSSDYGSVLIFEKNSGEIIVNYYTINGSALSSYNLTKETGSVSVSDCTYDDNYSLYSGYWEDEEETPYFTVTIGKYFFGHYQYDKDVPLGIFFGEINYIGNVEGTWIEPDFYWNYGNFILTYSNGKLTGTFGYEDYNDEEDWGAMTRIDFTTSWLMSFVIDFDTTNDIFGTFMDCGVYCSSSKYIPLHVCDYGGDDFLANYKGDYLGRVKGDVYENDRVGVGYYEEWADDDSELLEGAVVYVAIREYFVASFFIYSSSGYEVDRSMGEYNPLFLKYYKEPQETCQVASGSDDIEDDGDGSFEWIIVVLVVGIVIVCFGIPVVIVLGAKYIPKFGEYTGVEFGFGGGKYGRGHIINHSIHPQPVVIKQSVTQEEIVQTPTYITNIGQNPQQQTNQIGNQREVEMINTTSVQPPQQTVTPFAINLRRYFINNNNENGIVFCSIKRNPETSLFEIPQTFSIQILSLVNKVEIAGLVKILNFAYGNTRNENGLMKKIDELSMEWKKKGILIRYGPYVASGLNSRDDFQIQNQKQQTFSNKNSWNTSNYNNGIHNDSETISEPNVTGISIIPQNFRNRPINFGFPSTGNSDFFIDPNQIYEDGYLNDFN